MQKLNAGMQKSFEIRNLKKSKKFLVRYITICTSMCFIDIVERNIQF